MSDAAYDDDSPEAFEGTLMDGLENEPSYPSAANPHDERSADALHVQDDGLDRVLPVSARQEEVAAAASTPNRRSRMTAVLLPRRLNESWPIYGWSYRWLAMRTWTDGSAWVQLPFLYVGVTTDNFEVSIGRGKCLLSIDIRWRWS